MHNISSDTCKVKGPYLVLDVLWCVVRRQAPEVLMGSRCSEKVDIFSLGVVLWELVTGKHICVHLRASETFGSFACV